MAKSTLSLARILVLFVGLQCAIRQWVCVWGAKESFTLPISYPTKQLCATVIHAGTATEINTIVAYHAFITKYQGGLYASQSSSDSLFLYLSIGC